ncbi:hypothetical protein Pst134EA_004790 [Puccinia striiformis f. sp. tritici]|uniref:hypothetical protein n=1 Tax=Puccinia striiformis f. sp. tritici TaxID=168172 RepID=UPI002008131E|nr:hypothetical protein Pst134EA_004790 [Puccinia striiformis f. sp. tritici]KAH9470876.1 hypothetical protein Pst134EA_004790 [Puccinia striiformis f. sp. tritici]
MKINSINNQVSPQTRWRSLYLLHGLLIQIGSTGTSPIQSTEPPHSSNSNTLALGRIPTKVGWRLPEAFTLDDLHQIKTSNSLANPLENFLVVSRNTPVSETYSKYQQSQAAQALSLTSGNVLLVKYSPTPNLFGNQNPPRIPGSNFYAAPLNITQAKNVTFSYSLFVPNEYAFSNRIRIPGILGGKTSGEMVADGSLHSYVMIQEGGLVEYHIQNPQSNQQEPSTCMTVEELDCEQDGVTIFREGSRKLSRGIWTTIRQDVWIDSLGSSIEGFNLWINNDYVFGRSDLSAPTMTEDSSQTSDDLTDANESSVTTQRLSWPVIQKDTETQVLGLRVPQIIKQNLTQLQPPPILPIGKNLTGVLDSKNLTRINDDLNKNSRNNSVSHRDYGAFPALGIPELAKTNFTKTAPIPIPIPDLDEEDDDDDDDEDDDEEEDEDASSTEPVPPLTSTPLVSSTPNPKPKLDPLLSALGSILMQQEGPPLRLLGFFVDPFFIPSGSHLSGLVSKADNLALNPILLFRDFQISINPINLD